MTEDVCQMYPDGEAWGEIRTLYANSSFLLENRGIITRNPELYECSICGVWLGLMYSSGKHIDFLHLLEEWQKPDSPLVQVNDAGNACYTHAAGGSPLSGTNRCHAYCPAENAHYILHYKSLRIPYLAMVSKGGPALRPEPHRPVMCTKGSFLEFSRTDPATLPPMDCCEVYNPALTLNEMLALLHASQQTPGLADRVATVARLKEEGRYLQLQCNGDTPFLWVFDAADMTQAHRAYCVHLEDLRVMEEPPAGVAGVLGLAPWNPSEADLAELRRLLSGYSRHWGGISVAEFAQKRLATITARS